MQYVLGQGQDNPGQPVKIQDDLYVRDYERCILCYKCVEACGEEAQHTFAITTAGRGFEAHISTEFDIELPDSACVYCGNCIGVCPTGALVFKTEHDMREDNSWNPDEQTITETVCGFCGVGCNLELHTQDEKIVNGWRIVLYSSVRLRYAILTFVVILKKKILFFLPPDLVQARDGSL